MSYRIFVSHTRADMRLVEMVRDHAEGMGITVYLYERDSQGGRDISDKLQSEIRRCDALIALLTESGDDSAFVHEEIGYAMGHSKLVIPLTLRGGDRRTLAMLAGKEHIAIDPDSPAEGTAALVQSLHRGQQSKTQEQLIVTLAMIVLVIAVYWLTRTTAN